MAMLKKEEATEHIKGISVCKGAPRLSHLLFADDSIVFGRATVEESNRVMKVLEDYESSQKLNKEKTSPFFLAKTPIEMCRTKRSNNLEPKLSDTMTSTSGCRH